MLVEQFQKFFNSSASVKIEPNKFTKLTKGYTPFIDVGRSKGKRPPIKPLIEWVARKKYGISFSTEKEKIGIAYAIANKQAKEGSFKRRNTSQRSNIIETAIEETTPMLLRDLGQTTRRSIESALQDLIRDINSL